MPRWFGPLWQLPRHRRSPLPPPAATSPAGRGPHPCRHQMDQALMMDQAAKVTAILTWGASGLKLAMHSLRAEALLAASCCLAYTALLAASCWRRGAYLRHASYITAASLLQSHGAAAYISATGYSMMAGRWGVLLGVCSRDRVGMDGLSGDVGGEDAAGRAGRLGRLAACCANWLNWLAAGCHRPPGPSPSPVPPCWAPLPHLPACLLPRAGTAPMCFASSSSLCSTTLACSRWVGRGHAAAPPVGGPGWAGPGWAGPGCAPPPAQHCPTLSDGCF